jgi:glucose/arabinose dehydrogenase
MLAAFVLGACSDGRDQTSLAGREPPAAGSGGTGGSAASGAAGSGAAAGDSGGAAGESPGGAGTGESGGAERSDPCRGIALPSAQHHVMAGLCARAVAIEQEGLRQITFADSGDLLGALRSGAVVRYRDLNDDGVFQGDDEIVVIADSGGNGNNVHLDEAAGFLYAGSEEGVVRFAYSEDADALGDPEPVVVDQPSDGTHPYHTVHVYDGMLYVHSGSENNAVAPALPAVDTNRAVLKRFDLSTFTPGEPFAWSTGEVVVSGIRNMVGFTRDPDGRMFGVVNGIDNLWYAGEDIHLDNPGEDVIRIEAGVSHGYPYCFTAQRVEAGAGMVAPGTQLASTVEGLDNPHDDAWCAENAAPPVSFMPAHSAPLDIAFHPGAGVPDGLPDDLRSGGAFVTQHGSWNAEPSVGYQVVFLPLDDGASTMPATDGEDPTFPYRVVFSGSAARGAAGGAWGWASGDAGEDVVRPVGVAVSPRDGALYVSSDGGGVLYRIGRPLE